jgi:hypothetical protein
VPTAKQCADGEFAIPEQSLPDEETRTVTIGTTFLVMSMASGRRQITLFP